MLRQCSPRVSTKMVCAYLPLMPPLARSRVAGIQRSIRSVGTDNIIPVVDERKRRVNDPPYALVRGSPRHG